jgi:hypothetical protein
MAEYVNDNISIDEDSDHQSVVNLPGEDTYSPRGPINNSDLSKNTIDYDKLLQNKQIGALRIDPLFQHQGS